MKGARLRLSPLGPRCAAQGLTLLEALVVFVLIAMLGGAMVQGVGFFAGQYAAGQRAHGQASAASLRQRWFLDTVQGMNPYGVAARRFVGDAASFSGITLQPLFAAPGMPVRAQWAIAEGEGDAPGQTVTYREDAGPPWPVFSARRRGLFFRYADAAGEWHERWPVPAAPQEWTPTLICLASAQGDLWIARVEASPTPVLTEEALR